MILIISVAFQIFFVQVPAVAEFFYIKPLNHWEQLMSVLIGMSCVPFGKHKCLKFDNKFRILIETSPPEMVRKYQDR